MFHVQDLTSLALSSPEGEDLEEGDDQGLTFQMLFDGLFFASLKHS